MGIRGIAAFAAVLSFVSAPVFGGKKSLDESWKDLGLKFDRLQKSFNNTACQSEEKKFLACVRGVDVTLDYDQEALTLLPESYRAAHSDYGPAVETFGAVSIVKVPKSKAKTTGEFIRENRRITAETQQAWKDLYLQVSTTDLEIDFEAIKTWLKGRPFFAEKESQIFGAVTNAFYEILKDPHTAVIPVPHYKKMNEPEPEIVGIGVLLQVTEKDGKKYPVVVRLVEDGPAHKAGLLPKDLLISVNGKDIGGNELDEITSSITGGAGTELELGVLRKDATLTFKMARAKVENRNVSSKMVGKNGDIGYVRLDNFMEIDEEKGPLPCLHVKDAIADVESKGAKSLIFDLRGNGGGLLVEAVCISNLFLDLEPGEPIVLTKSLVPDKKSSMLPADKPAPIFTKLPMVLLINGQSASASEIVAGALQDYQRAFLIGEDSYGKGTVQDFQPLGTKGELILKQTIARFYMPSGRTNQIATVKVDVTRYSVPNPTEDDKTTMREADYYTAFPPVGPQWVQPRPETIARLEECMKRTGTAEADYKSHLEDALGADFQLYSAIDAANCVVSENLWTASDKHPHFELPEWLQIERAKDFFELIKENLDFRFELRTY